MGNALEVGAIAQENDPDLLVHVCDGVVLPADIVSRVEEGPPELGFEQAPPETPGEVYGLVILCVGLFMPGGLVRLGPLRRALEKVGLYHEI